MHGIYDVRLKQKRSWYPQGVVPGLHLGKFVAPLRVGIHRRAHAIRRDELHSHAFRRISAGNFHHARGAARQSALYRPLLRGGAIPGIRPRIFPFDAALSFLDVRDQIGDVRVLQRAAERRHPRPAIPNFRGDIFDGHGIAGHQLRMLEELLQIRASLGVLVVAHPAFIKVNVFAAPRTAVGDHPVGVQPRRALKIVRVHYLGGAGRRRSTRRRRLGTASISLREKGQGERDPGRNHDANSRAAVIFHGIPYCRQSLVQTDFSALARCYA
jgi:hypothetical protein